MEKAGRMSGEAQIIVLSIKPVWADLIISGRKTVELRRRFPKLSNGSVTALLYSTGPVMAMVGTVNIESTLILPPDELWSRVAERACVTKKQYRAYFDGAKDASALFLGAVTALASPISLSHLRSFAGFAPPMSWRRAKAMEIGMVRGIV